jgi:hypothetical protein
MHRHHAASTSLFRAHFDEEGARAALLLEAAAYCLLRCRPASVRKAAFQLVLAGLRYHSAKQKRLSIHCYKQVRMHTLLATDYQVWAERCVTHGGVLAGCVCVPSGPFMTACTCFCCRKANMSALSSNNSPAALLVSSPVCLLGHWHLLCQCMAPYQRAPARHPRQAVRRAG